MVGVGAAGVAGDDDGDARGLPSLRDSSRFVKPISDQRCGLSSQSGFSQLRWNLV